MSPLETIVQQIGEAVLATTETVDHLASQVNALTMQVQSQSQQIQQQGYQIFALSDLVQTLAEAQQDSLEGRAQLTNALQRLIGTIEAQNNYSE
ncbi:hypothetical protein [Neosynechococcus sphagnicola]|uniref:hypothetical protein n=1 Tax=Neosynechococcus sphagnicola TaxID=1501145 RepID=UPI000A56B5A7|nr:hypothetical protein [Neosynechococcus sphagnicola]